MISLSTRLRDTNARLQKLEAGGTGKPYENSLKMLEILSLLWYKDGEKEGKEYLLQKVKVQEIIGTIFDMDSSDVNKFLQGLTKAEIFASRNDQYNNSVLAIKNRGEMERLTSFIRGFVGSNPTSKCLPDGAIQILKILKQLGDASAYDTATVPFEEVVANGNRESLDTSTWQSYLPFFKQKNDALTLVKVSSGIGFRVQRKEFAKYLKMHECLQALDQAGVAN
jgi:hypothetical protein